MFSNPKPTPQRRGHALVIGGGIAGLLAARVLADHFTRVTLVERTRFPGNAACHGEVWQADQAHLLVERGQAIIEQLFPGFIQELHANGGVTLNMGRDCALYLQGAWRCSFTSAIVNISTSRLRLAAMLYQRLASHPQLQMLPEHEVLALETNESGNRVVGVHLRMYDTGSIRETFLPADLVVDASGRDSQTPVWLTHLGYVPPMESTVNAFPGYVTRIYQQPGNFNAPWKMLSIMPTASAQARGGLILPLEGDRWQVTLLGMAKDYPATDEAAFLEFARSLPSLCLYEAIKEAEGLTAPTGYYRAENRLRAYAQLPRYLEGFVVCGDAVCALNPFYCQGITVAMLGTLLLDTCLKEQRKRARHGELTGVAKRFQKRLAAVIAPPWHMAIGQELGWSGGAGGKQPGIMNRLLRQYVAFVLAALPHNRTIAEAFCHVQTTGKSPLSLLYPPIVWQVLRAQVRAKPSVTAGIVATLEASVAAFRR